MVKKSTDEILCSIPENSSPRLLNFFEENEDEEQYEQQIGHRSPVTLENGYKPVITDFLCENETSDFSCDSSSSSNEDENQRFISTSVSGRSSTSWRFLALIAFTVRCLLVIFCLGICFVIFVIMTHEDRSG